MRYVLVLIVGMFTFAPLHAHTGSAALAAEPESIFTLEQLSDHVWVVYGRGGNVGFLVTDEGVLVVDDQYDNVAQGIVDQIRTVTDKPIRFLINTHFHVDHTGGNTVFARHAEIIAHDSVRYRMTDYRLERGRELPAEVRRLQTELEGLKDEDDPYQTTLTRELSLVSFLADSDKEFDPGTVTTPALTFDRGLRVWLADQKIEVFHVSPGHTDGDVVVYFVNEKVLHMGDDFWNGMYPFIDTRGGGSFSGMITTIDRALEIAAPDATVIPGHGKVTDMAALKRFRGFLNELQQKVRRAVQEGMSPAEAIRSIKMDDYPEITPQFMALGNDILAAWRELKPGSLDSAGMPGGGAGN